MASAVEGFWAAFSLCLCFQHFDVSVEMQLMLSEMNVSFLFLMHSARIFSARVHVALKDIQTTDLCDGDAGLASNKIFGHLLISSTN